MSEPAQESEEHAMSETEVRHGATRTSKGSSRQRSLQDLLLELLSIGRLVMTRQWNFTARDWVTCVYAEDIDGDSDVEVVMGSRDGCVRVLNRRGMLRWERSLGNLEWITALAHLPGSSTSDIDTLSRTAPLALNDITTPRIIVGTRSGHVRALTQQGKLLPEEKWHFQITENEGVRALAIHPRHPGEVIVGGDDRSLYLLNSNNGALQWQYQFEGRVHSICVADVDGDGEDEIVASATDKHIHILTRTGILKGSIPLNYKSYVLAIDVPQAGEGQQPAGHPTIFACYQGKGLRGWTIPEPSTDSTLSEQLASLQPTWPQPKAEKGTFKGRAQLKPEKDVIKSRPLTVHLADINNDGHAELLIGCTDQSLAILDHTGQLLWRHNFGSTIYSVYASDYDNDGIYEIFVGLGNHALRVMKVDLSPIHEFGPESNKPLYSQIQEVVEKMRRLGKEPEIRDEALNELASELGLLQSEQKLVHREFHEAVLRQNQENYKEAIAIFQRLHEQRVHHYWPHPLTNLGYIRALTVGDIQGNPLDEVEVGNDGGEVTAFDIKNAFGNDRSHKVQELWKQRARLGASIVALQSGRQNKEDFAITLVVLANRTLRLLNAEGKELPLPASLLEKHDRVTSLVMTYEAQHSTIIDDTLIKEVLLGLESGDIYIYDKHLKERWATIKTSHSIRMLYACDMTGSGRLDILVGDADHNVRLYTQDEKNPAHFEEQWCYPTRDRIRAIKAVDLNNDGRIEVIVGSEDRNLYVLNQDGKLEWRYLMPDTVLCLDACDIDGDGLLEIVTGAPDGRISFFNCEGDLLRELQVGDRVNALLVKDLHPGEYSDTFVEIVVGTDNALLLYQVLHREEIEARIDECWRLLRNTFADRKLLSEYSDWQHREDEYLRVFALSRLAGLLKHQEEDFEVLKKAVTNDPSPVVARALATVVVNVYRSSIKREDWRRRAQQLLNWLAQKPQRETKIAIANVLDVLAQDDPALSLFYLEKFLGNEDFRLRRMVIRQLYNLTDPKQFLHEKVRDDPHQQERVRPLSRRVFPLLITGTQDQHLWVRQESGRSLARYFDLNQDRLFVDLHALVGDGIDSVVVEQIAISAKDAGVKHFFVAYSTFLQTVHSIYQRNPLEGQPEEFRQKEKDDTFRTQKKLYKNALEAFIQKLEHIMQIHALAEDLLAVYKDLNNLLEVNSLEALEQFQLLSLEGDWEQFTHFIYIGNLLKRFVKVVEKVKLARRSEAFTDKAATLMEVIYDLNQVRHQFIDARKKRTLLDEGTSTSSLAVEDILLRAALQQWYMLLRNTLLQLRGRAKLVIRLLTETTQSDDEIELFFELVNEGSSIANDIHVLIMPSVDYEIIRQPICTALEISPTKAAKVSCTLKTKRAGFWVMTEVRCTDAEGLQIRTVDHRVERKSAQMQIAFQEIINPYHGGTPIGSKENDMFYGRAEDIKFLRTILSNTGSRANHIVLLLGQRRTGKTSVLNRLVSEMKEHIPVLLDMQALAMSTSMADLFFRITQVIDLALQEHNYSPPLLFEANFHENPRQMLDRYLELVVQQLNGRRLVLLIDEFEVFNQLIREKRLDANFLHYLRSLMQNRLGVNYLLAGAPYVWRDNNANRSAFFNTAQHHALRRLEPNDARELFVNPIKDYLTYDPLALDRMLCLTGGQPLLIHMLSEEIIHYCNQHRQRYANTNDVNALIDKVLGLGQLYFTTTWGIAKSPLQRLLLSLMARDQKADENKGQFFSLADLQEEFQRLEIPFESNAVRRALKHLTQEEVIDENADGHSYSIQIGLLRAWIQKGKLLDRVLVDDNESFLSKHADLEPAD